MRAAGVDAEIRIYEGVRHGFGLGLGTPAEGWLEKAADFWRRHLPPER
jgi:acetyl esterase/lipase